MAYAKVCTAVRTIDRIATGAHAGASGASPLPLALHPPPAGDLTG